MDTQVEITKVKVPPYLENEISEAMNQGVFFHKIKSFKDRNQNWRRSKVIVQNKVEIAWMSSPRALKQTLEDVIHEKDKVTFSKPEEFRLKMLNPILYKIEEHALEDDPKLMALVLYLRRFYSEGRKVLIFTERQLTALYLEDAIAKLCPFIKVASTIKESSDGSELKDFTKEVIPLLKGFAPIANKDKISSKDKLTNYNVLIATDAYSTGVNLQDASVVVNYDLAWTPDVLIQRAGRILRFWKDPRRVHFLVFTGKFEADKKGQEKTHKVEQRLRQLSSRSKKAQKFSEIPIIPESDTASYKSLGDLSNVTIEEIGLVEVSELEEFSGVSPFLKHIAVLKKHNDRANKIPDDISSAFYYSGACMLMYLLFKIDGHYEHVLYDVYSKSIRPIKEDEVLDLVQCLPDTLVANIAADKIERLAQRGRALWEGQSSSNSHIVTHRICACLLIPEGKKIDFEELLSSEIMDEVG